MENAGRIHHGQAQVGIIAALLALLLVSPAFGQPAPPLIDPTENVKALSEAANKRQDDLRDASERLTRALLEAQAKLGALRDEHAKEIQSLRATYDERLLIAEAKRIDAIRSVDVNAVAVDRTRANDQALVLATQVSQSAEALRTLVATTASTAAASLQQVVNTLSARITSLEQAGYQQAGKQTFQDPAFVALVAEVKMLAASRADQAGIGTGRSEVIAWIVAAGSVLASLASFAFAMLKSKGK